MANLMVQDISSETIAALERRATLNNRSLNGEVLCIFHWIVEHDSDIAKSDDEIPDPVVARQKREMRKLIGSWKDDRPIDKIISDLMESRTTGREVSL